MTRRLTAGILTCAAVVLLRPAAAPARTTLEIVNGEIVITMYIAFRNVGRPLVDRWAKEIVDVWNGPAGYQTYGECGHKVRFKVVHTVLPAGAEVPKGYHWVDVVHSNNSEESLPQTPDGRRAIAYMGRTTRSPSVRGASIDGVWSTRSSTAVDPRKPRGERFKDAAHEAGHMMGLGDCYDHKTKFYGHNIMGSTSGPYAVVTPALVRNVVEALTGNIWCPACPPPWELPPVKAVTVRNVAAGLSFISYQGRFRALPDFSKIPPKKTGNVSSPTSAIPDAPGSFAIVFEGYIKVPDDGCYTFYLRSDDGSRLEIAGKLVADNDGEHGMWTKRGLINLQAGLHPIRLCYFNGSGRGGLELRYSSATVPKQRVPESAFFRNR